MMGELMKSYSKEGVKVAVILPSRGLMFSETAEEIIKNLKDVPYKMYFAHGLPIPACFETPTNEALDNPTITHLWFVEDDMVLKPNTLKDMLDIDKAVVTANYPTSDKMDCALLTIKGRIVYGGTGCLLVKREVFDELKKPYFRSDIIWSPRNMGNYIKFIGMHRADGGGYGFQDVNFYINLFKLNIPVHKLSYNLKQRKLVSLGKQGSNKGQHIIKIWSKMRNDRFFKLKKNIPKCEESFFTSVIIDGNEINVSQEHARKLIKMGKATRPQHRYLMIDDSEVSRL
jgi:hypothetical protein